MVPHAHHISLPFSSWQQGVQAMAAELPAKLARKYDCRIECGKKKPLHAVTYSSKFLFAYD